MSTPSRAELARVVVASGWPARYALFAVLRSGQPLPSDVAWALADLLTQLAVTVDAAEAGEFDGAPLGWLDVLGRAEHNLIDEWTRAGGEAAAPDRQFPRGWGDR